MPETRERGATVCIVGELKTPDALRNASDQFFAWHPTEPDSEPINHHGNKVVTAKPDPVRAPSAPHVKRRPKFIVEAVSLLASDTSEGKVGLSALGQYLKRMDPAFSPTAYGHSGLLDMLKTYNLLALKKAEGGHYTVGLSAKNEADVS